jgi:hypothetical protein
MRYFIITIMLITVQGCAGWSVSDKAKFSTFIGLQAVDTAQSIDYIRNDTELNPLFKSNESLVIVKLLGIGTIYLLSSAFPEDKDMILNISCIMSGGVVMWNLSQE